MTTTDQYAKLLDPSSLSLPASPRVVRIECHPGFDYGGDPAVYIWVLMDDATPEAEQTLKKVRPIEHAIRARLEEAGETRWPYVRFRTESEHRMLSEQSEG